MTNEDDELVYVACDDREIINLNSFYALLVHYHVIIQQCANQKVIANLIVSHVRVNG